VTARGRVAEPYACRRCGRVIARGPQLCVKRTPASPVCWPPDGDGFLEIQPGLLLRPGGGAEHPVMQPDDPYAE
jgi:hypothetical protein